MSKSLSHDVSRIERWEGDAVSVDDAGDGILKTVSVGDAVIVGGAGGGVLRPSVSVKPPVSVTPSVSVTLVVAF